LSASVTGNDSQFVTIGGTQYSFRYSMQSLEKIELQFGSIGEMQKLLTDGTGEIRMDRPVIGLLIDIVHAGLLDHFPNTPEGRTQVASGFEPQDMPAAVEAMTVAFGASFGDLLGKAPTPNRAARRASPGASGTTPRPSRSGGPRRTGNE
jgi:hypothetical protein